MRPFVRADDDGDEIDGPGLACAGLGEQVVGHAVFEDEPAQALMALGLLLGRQRAEGLRERRPCGPHRAIGGHGLVEAVPVPVVSGKEPLRRGQAVRHTAHCPNFAAVSRARRRKRLAIVILPPPAASPLM